VNFGNYLKTAFLNRWNLLALFGGAGFALLSGQADVLLPLVMAVELGYLGLLGSHPKFQKYVDAQQAQSLRDQSDSARQRTLQHIIRALPKDLLDRFETLRSQCLELRHIAMELKGPGMAGADLPLEQFQISGLDRLLWIHLRLLYTQHSLARFLARTDAKRIESDIQQLQNRIDRLPKAAESPGRQRMRAALEDSLQTSRTRLENLGKARDNYQLVNLDIERLENKIRSLSEMAINRQEPQFISSQVDHVAASMMETERTMNELQFATGLDALDSDAPEMLRPKATQTE